MTEQLLLLPGFEDAERIGGKVTEAPIRDAAGITRLYREYADGGYVRDRLPDSDKWSRWYRPWEES